MMATVLMMFGMMLMLYPFWHGSEHESQFVAIARSMKEAFKPSEAMPSDMNVLLQGLDRVRGIGE